MASAILPGQRLIAIHPMTPSCRDGDTWIAVEHFVGDDWTCINERTGERCVWSLPDTYHFLRAAGRVPLEALA